MHLGIACESRVASASHRWPFILGFSAWMPRGHFIKFFSVHFVALSHNKHNWFPSTSHGLIKSERWWALTCGRSSDGHLWNCLWFMIFALPSPNVSGIARMKTCVLAFLAGELSFIIYGFLISHTSRDDGRLMKTSRREQNNNLR